MNEVERDNTILQIGFKASGKTEFCRRVMEWQKPKRCLVLDFNNEYQDLDTVELEDEFFNNPSEWEAHSGKREDWDGHKRIALWEDRKDREKQMEIALKAIKAFTQGLLIIEDANNLTRSRDKELNGFVPFGKYLTIPMDLIGLLSTPRSRRTSVIINTQCFAWLAHPKIGANCDFVVIRKTPDSIKQYANALHPQTNLEVLRAEQIVKTTFIESVTIKI